jgi:hypothetical protein
MELTMNNISITDLTVRQCQLLDTMWQLQNQEEFESWSKKLSQSDQLQVQTLQQILVHECMEGLLEITGLEESCDVLKRFRI